MARPEIQDFNFVIFLIFQLGCIIKIVEKFDQSSAIKNDCLRKIINKIII